ncbi:hypothetical protein EUGRSUZ_G02890 [Eucalyptus grandis]|uniref:Uncharacterized protein n=1 Tax=Eucalyptus grandis TaxID=71139 RepID=A0ACC3K7H0_EUCGR|nr:hypothetical protein EUGRSUZ_G02890 [Eucalyptus grandis]
MGDSSSASYIHMVHHLIEKCLIFRMSKEECMDALSKHANIKPVITSTVWNELEKENKEFFEEYAQRSSPPLIPPPKIHTMTETTARMTIQTQTFNIFSLSMVATAKAI